MSGTTPRSANSAHSAADNQFAGEITAEMFLSRCGEGLERSLHNSLRPDVDPGTGGHLPEHHQTGAFEFVELFPVGPVTYEIRVRNENSGSVIVGFENADRFSRLHQQSFVVRETLQSCNDGAIGFPTSGGASGSTVDHEISWTLGNLLVKVVHEHAHGSFLLPSLAGDGIASRRANGRGSLNFRFNRHE